MKLRAFLDEYLATHTSVKSPDTPRLMGLSVRHFEKFLEKSPQVEDLTDRNLCAYVQHRRALGKADSTVEREVAKLYTLANAAALAGLNPAPRSRPFKADPTTPIGFTPLELRRLFKAAFRYDRKIGGVPGNVYMPALVYTFWDSLERSGAVWYVERGDLDLNGWRGWIVLKDRKGNGRPLQRRLRWKTTRLVRKLLKSHAHDKAFSLGKDRTALHYHWRRLLQLAEIKDDRWHGPHCIRRTGASEYHRRGGNATEILDHSDPRIFDKHYKVPGIAGDPQPLDKLRDPLGWLPRLTSLVRFWALAGVVFW